MVKIVSFPFLSFLPSLAAFLSFALGLLWQCVDSLRCANPFDIGWIDSCWQDAPCHFVCCHLIGAPQFAFPPLSPTHAHCGQVLSDIKGEVMCPFKKFKALLFGWRGPFAIATGAVKQFMSCYNTFTQIKNKEMQSWQRACIGLESQSSD